MIGRLKVQVIFSEAEQAEETFDALKNVFSEMFREGNTLTVWATKDDLTLFLQGYLRDYCT